VTPALVRTAVITALLILVFFLGLSWWLSSPRPDIGLVGGLTALVIGFLICTSHVAALFALHRFVPKLREPGLHQLLWVFPIGFLAVLVGDFLFNNFVHPQLTGTAVGIAVFGVYAEIFRRITGTPPWYAPPKA
jgi:hypothetical protein